MYEHKHTLKINGDMKRVDVEMDGVNHVGWIKGVLQTKRNSGLTVTLKLKLTEVKE